jgi:hypothetical protein
VCYDSSKQETKKGVRETEGVSCHEVVQSTVRVMKQKPYSPIYDITTFNVNAAVISRSIDSFSEGLSVKSFDHFIPSVAAHENEMSAYFDMQSCYTINYIGADSVVM